jgi:diguanylate cyclase (GGDEF)-like protein
VATSSETPEERSRKALIKEAGVAGKAFASGETVILDDPEPSDLAETSATAIRSLITVPLHSIGVFQAASDKRGAFSSADVRLLEILLRHTSAAIERLRLESALKEQATHDPLTGVFNRRYFNDVIEIETLRAKRYEHPIGLLMIDVNRFKEINDQRGHHVGDGVLQTIAGVLLQTVRGTDLVVRYGGDEFLVVLTETGTDAEQVADRIRSSVMRSEKLRLLASSEVTVSVGTIAWHPASGTPLAHVLAQADERMYEEKRKR